MQKRAYQRFSVGDRFGRLVIISHAADKALCKCDCGTEKLIGKDGMRDGRIVSCGCFHKERTSAANSKHRLCESGAYASWDAMIQRCTNPKTKKYAYYGGRGISVCAQWLSSFEQFHSDMGDRPIGMTIDRRETNGNYEPGNCKWATKSEQALNKRQRFMWVVNGAEYKTIAAASDEFGVCHQTILNWCAGYENNGRFLPPRAGCMRIPMNT
jgi:hypothetical protein